jgi:urease accessory protein
MQNVVRLFVFALLAAPTTALAHDGHGEAAGFLHGFAHPFGGADHVVAMVAVGLLAYQLGGRSLWLVPAAYVAVMAIGGLIGAAGVALPYVEAGIAVSIIVLGAAIAFGVKAQAMVAAGIVGLFAIFHGYAHGSEMPLAGSAAQYGIGFIAATALLHLVGIGAGIALARFGKGRSTVYRMAGFLIAVTGTVVLTPLI